MLPSGTLDNCELAWPHSLLCFEASTCMTCAPFFAATMLAMPVYPNKFRTRGLFKALTHSSSHSQFAACSGKTPVCLKPVSRIEKRASRQASCHSAGKSLFFQEPLPPSQRNSALAFCHCAGLFGLQRACVSGRII